MSEKTQAEALTILPHALKQYLKRSGTSEKHQVRAMEFLFSAAENGTRIGGGMRYYRGWCVVVVEKRIITAHRPTQRWVQNKIYDAHIARTQNGLKSAGMA